MTSLQSISELLKSGKVADTTQRVHLLDLMAGECNRLGRYLHNVLDFGRIEQDAKRYDIRETDLKPVVADVVEIVKWAVADEDLELAVDLPDGPVRVEADPDAVRQALLNLVDNAVKYGGKRKRVAVRLGRDGGRRRDLRPRQRHRHPGRRPRAHLRGLLSLPRGRPARSEGRRPGAHDRQARHGRPRRRRRGRERAGAGDDVHPEIPGKAGTMKKILIIDDDRVLRQTLAAALAAEGYGVAEAADGREGLNKALKGNYDLVVLDVVMPSLTGLDVCRKLREAGRQIPVIVMSGKKKKEVDKVLGLELGGDDYLTKPFGTDEFIARVHAVLRRSRPEIVEIEDCAFGDVADRLPEEDRDQGRPGPSPDGPGVQPAPAPGRLRGPGRLPRDDPQQGLGLREVPDDADDRHLHVQPAAEDRGRPGRAASPGHGAVAGLQVPALIIFSGRGSRSRSAAPPA